MSVRPTELAAEMQRCKPRLLGVDFTSAPTRRKPIMVATGQMNQGVLVVEALEALATFAEFEQFLCRPGPWVGGFDMPFGLPRELVETLNWPTDWAACIDHYAGHSREELRAIFKRFCDARPRGNKFAHRQTDIPAKSSPSMKWVNPPVAWMLHAGVPRLLRANVSIPGLHCADSLRHALEVYPGMLARSVTPASYKSDTPARQTSARKAARGIIVQALLDQCVQPGVPVRLAPIITEQMIDDGSGDALDAVLCLVQTAWALSNPDQRYGLPVDLDTLEGWIVGA